MIDSILLWCLSVPVFLFLGLLYIGHRAHRADWGNWFLNCLDGINRLLCHHYHRLSAETVPLPEAGPAILAANHISGLDPMILCAISTRPLHFMIAREQYERFGLQWLFKAVGCIPVDRKGRPEKSLRDALRALQAGKVIGIFPQGTIQDEANPTHKLKGGIVRLAAWANAPVYPVHISGIAGTGHVVLAPFIRSQVTINISEPIRCDVGTMHDALEQIQHKIEQGK
jgi:1-acyl-sn-glycerol-3-phosphate acyltransferase